MVKATTSSQTSGVNHKRREHGLRAALRSRRLSCVRLMAAGLNKGKWAGVGGVVCGRFRANIKRGKLSEAA